MSSVIISGDTSGAITLSAPTVAGTNTITLPAGTGTVAVQGVSTNIVSGTAVASTSGTSIDFTGIPSWVKRVTVNLNTVSVSGSSNILVQLGSSGSVETTGYLGGYGIATSGAAVTVGTSTAGIPVFTNDTNYRPTGSIVFSLVSGTTWVASGVIVNNNSVPWMSQSAGTKTLVSALDRVRITTVNGTDTFDAGSINILYE